MTDPFMDPKILNNIIGIMKGQCPKDLDRFWSR